MNALKVICRIIKDVVLFLAAEIRAVAMPLSVEDIAVPPREGYHSIAAE